MIDDCLNYKIAIQWLSSRPIGVPFARCVTTLGPDHKRDRIKSIPTKSVDALALDRQKDPRSIAPKVTLDDREERFTLEWGESHVADTHSWKPLVTVVHGDRINRLLLTTR